MNHYYANDLSVTSVSIKKFIQKVMYSRDMVRMPENTKVTTRRKRYLDNSSRSLSINNDAMMGKYDKVVCLRASNRLSKSVESTKSLPQNVTVQDLSSSSIDSTVKINNSYISNRTTNTTDEKVLRKSVTPKNSPVAIICTPHRSTKTPKKSPLNLTSPKSHSEVPSKLSKVPRKLLLKNCENIRNKKRLKRDINNTVNNESLNSTILKKKHTSTRRSVLQTKFKSPKIVLKTPKIKLKESKLSKLESPLRKRKRNSLVGVTKASIKKTSTPITLNKFNKFLQLPLHESKNLCTDVEKLNNVSALYRAALLSKPKVVLERLPFLDNVKSIQNGAYQLRTTNSHNKNPISILPMSSMKESTVIKSSSTRLKRLNKLKHSLNKETRSSLKSVCSVKKNIKKMAKKSRSNEKKNVDVNVNPLLKFTSSTPVKMIKSSTNGSTKKITSRNISTENIVVPSNHILNLTYDNINDILSDSCKNDISMTKENDNLETTVNETYEICEAKTLNLRSKCNPCKVNLDNKKGIKGSNKVRFNIPKSDKNATELSMLSKRNRESRATSTLVNKLKNNTRNKKVTLNDSSRNSHFKANHLQNISTNNFDVKTPVAKKVPNFTEIHKKLFANMESIVDEKKRKRERYVELTKSKIPVISLNKNARSPVLSKIVDVSQNKYRSKLRKNEATDIILTKQRTNQSYRTRRREETREMLKNVRTNRRFELQMKFLKITV